MKACVQQQCVNRAPPCTQGQPKCIVSGSNWDGGAIKQYVLTAQEFLVWDAFMALIICLVCL